jgi:Arc/MetJ family transcription regulator
MRTTITLDDDLLATAMRLTGITDRTPLIRESLKAIIAREAARRLALLGGSMPDIQLTPRRRSEPEPEAVKDQAPPAAKLVRAKPARKPAKNATAA